MTAFDNRPVLHYPGDVTETVGQVVGPTLAGEWYAVDDVAYDKKAGRSTVRLRYATPADMGR